MHLNVNTRAIYNSQVLEATHVPISKWMDLETGTFTQWNAMQQKKKKGAPALCDSMDGSG